ncbi:MAG: hypothetical protein ACR2NS_04880 [Gemmatimonadaceae bacterium]
MKSSAAPVGIRGWLAVFAAWAVLQLVVSFRGFMDMLPIAGASQITPMFFPALDALLLYTVSFLLTVIGLWLMIRRSPRCPAYWTIVILVSVPITFRHLFLFEQLRLLAGTASIAGVGEQAGLYSVLRMLVLLGWAGYWFRSKRVLATFGARGFGRPWAYGRNRWRELREGSAPSTRPRWGLGLGVTAVAVLAALGVVVMAVGTTSQRPRSARPKSEAVTHGSVARLEPVYNELRESRTCETAEPIKLAGSPVIAGGRTCAYLIGSGISFRHDQRSPPAIHIVRVSDAYRRVLFHPAGDCIAVMDFHPADSSSSVAFLSNRTGQLTSNTGSCGAVDWSMEAKRVALIPAGDSLPNFLFLDFPHPFEQLRQSRVCIEQSCRYAFDEKRFAIIGMGTDKPAFAFLASDSTTQTNIWLDAKAKCVVVAQDDFGQGRPNKTFEAYVSARDGRIYRDRAECGS